MATATPKGSWRVPHTRVATTKTTCNIHTHALHLSASIHTFGPLCSTSYNNKQQQDICCPKRQNAAEASPGCRLAAAPLFLLHCMLSPVTMLPNKICSTKLRLQLLDFWAYNANPFFCVEPVKSCHQSQVAFNLSISFSSHPKPNSRETQKCKILNSCIQNCSQL